MIYIKYKRTHPKLQQGFYSTFELNIFPRHQGDDWFGKAIERGAKTEDIDDEIKRVIKTTKDHEKRHKAALYLLKISFPANHAEYVIA
ncbi:MAG: hypothetical protein RMY34_28490 [Aulosira sp. DedQUE10]|nr:hypothetical protein [Aulosira sp. DedQUE10]